MNLGEFHAYVRRIQANPRKVVRAIRAFHKLSQEKFAHRCHVTLNTARHWQVGVKPTAYRPLCVLAELLHEAEQAAEESERVAVESEEA